MDSSVDIRQVESLMDLKNSLHRFKNEAGQSLERVNHLHQRIRDELFSMFISEKRKLERLLGMAQKRNRATALEINRVEERLDQIQKSLLRVEEQVSTYQKFAVRIKKLLSNEMIQAEQTVHIKIIELEEYMAVSMGFEQNLQPEAGTQNHSPGHPLDVYDPTEEGQF